MPLASPFSEGPKHRPMVPATMDAPSKPKPANNSGGDDSMTFPTASPPVPKKMAASETQRKAGHRRLMFHRPALAFAARNSNVRGCFSAA